MRRGSVALVSQDAAPTRPRVVVVDDHELYRTGVAGMLAGVDLDVVGVAADGEAGMSLIHRARPDVALIDLHMPGVGGMEAVRRLTAAATGTKLIVLTVSDEGQDVIDALLAGADGYLLKDASAEAIARAVRSVLDGDTVLAPGAVSRMVRTARDGRAGAAGPAPPRPDEPLSAREREVLALIVDGYDNAAIASALVISPNTVKNHVARILLKLRVANRIQAAVAAVRLGLA
jgi:DNA-binding NarL/FixJ family response regulator